MRDLQRRLAAAGFLVGSEELGTFGPGTADAVRGFQAERGLRVDGICGRHTWAALVEAGYRLGDRVLYLAEPMQRGDDVATLQRRVSALGFDTGRVDGILGPRTEQALREFQRNSGLVVDAICGPATLLALTRLGDRAGDPAAGVREKEALRCGPRSLTGRTVVVGEAGGLGALASAVGRELTMAGARVMTLQHPEGSDQAAAANAAQAAAYLGVALGEQDGCASSYYAAHGWESPSGRRLAEIVQRLLPPVLGVPDRGAKGMALPVLRETRMPAIFCELAPATAVVERGTEVARAFTEALTAWIASAE